MQEAFLKIYKEDKSTYPPHGTEVLGFRKEWIDDDFNPEGSRVCFWMKDDDYWMVAIWDNDMDSWHTYSEGDLCYGEKVLPPTHWIRKPLLNEFVSSDSITSLLNELFEEIKHGDSEHQIWLQNKIESFANRKLKN